MKIMILSSVLRMHYFHVNFYFRKKVVCMHLYMHTPFDIFSAVRGQDDHVHLPYNFFLYNFLYHSEVLVFVASQIFSILYVDAIITFNVLSAFHRNLIFK